MTKEPEFNLDRSTAVIISTAIGCLLSCAIIALIWLIGEVYVQ